MFSIFEKRKPVEMPAQSPAQEAEHWREAHDGLIAPEWIFSKHGYVLGSMIATASDTFTQIALKEVSSPPVQEAKVRLPAAKANAVMVAYVSSFVYRAFAAYWTHSVDIDDETHEITKLATKYAGTIVGPVDDVQDTLGDSAMRHIMDIACADGINLAGSMLKEEDCPPFRLADLVSEFGNDEPK